MVREGWQEIGVLIDPTTLKLLRSEKRQNHVFMVFRVDLPVTPSLRETGDGGEEVRMFQPEDILTLDNFMSAHKNAVEGILQDLVAKSYTN